MGQLIENTVLGGILILLTALARRLLRGKISPNAVLALWAVCALRLLTPVALTSPVSPWGVGTEGRSETVTVTAAPAPSQADGTVSNEVPQSIINEQTASAPQKTDHNGRRGGSRVTAGTVYGAVVLLAAARMLASFLTTRRRVLALPRVRDEYASEYLPRRAGLRVGRVPGAPFTFGVVRPSVVVTPDLSGTELRYVLRHEAVHVRRGDNLWHYLAALCVALHWFNPTVWLMAALIRRDVELSCDRAVLAGAGEDIRGEYARTIIDLSAAPKGVAFASGFARKRTEERIINIMKYRKTTIAGVLIAAALVCAVAVTALTPAQEKPEDTEFTASWEAGDGELRYHVTRAWTATEKSDIPEGNFKPCCSADPSLLRGDESDDLTFWRSGGTPTFIGEDGVFNRDIYMIFTEVEVTNDGASTQVLGESLDDTGSYPLGYLTDPYLFGGQYLLELSDAGRSVVYHPEFFSFYGEGYDPRGVEEWGEYYNFADACLAFRLEPGQTRTVALGFIITPDGSGALPDPVTLYARPCTGLTPGSPYDGPSAYLNLGSLEPSRAGEKEAPTEEPRKEDGFYPAWSGGWGEAEPYIYTVRFPEPITVTDPESGEWLELSSLSVKSDGFLWRGLISDENSASDLKNRAISQVWSDAGVSLAGGGEITGLYATDLDLMPDGSITWQGNWDSSIRLKSAHKGAVDGPVDMGTVESVTVQGVTYPVKAGPLTYGTMLYYESDENDLWNTKMVAELSDGTKIGFIVSYTDLTVTLRALPDEAALEEFGFDPDVWRTGHTAMPAGTLYYANARVEDAYTLRLSHNSPEGYAAFYYDLAAGRLTVDEICLDHVTW